MDWTWVDAMKADIGTFAALLAASAKKRDFCRGSQLHADLVKSGLLTASVVVADYLVIMYVKCGELRKAQELICEFSVESVFPWTALIAGYAQQGQAQDALACYESFRHRGMVPDAVMFACILKACDSMGAIDKVERIHKELAQEGLLRNDFVLTTVLVDLYAKRGELIKARRLLDELDKRDVIAWSALIAGYAYHGQGQNALECFQEMKGEGIMPNEVTVACILKVCGAMGNTDIGEKIHSDIVKEGFIRKDVVLGNILVEMYTNFDDLSKARQVFEELPVKNVVSWSAIIRGYVEHGQGAEALRCFKHMQHEGLPPDSMIFMYASKACGMMKATDQGQWLHNEIARQGLLEGNLVLATALVDMYVKCEALSKAQEVLKELCVRDVISWNALIAGYAQQGLGQEALESFQQMQDEGLSPDLITFISTLKACSSIGAIDKGQQIHDEIARQGLLDHNMALGGSLVDMYVKCGELTKAKSILEGLRIKDSFSWSALIVGYALQGHVEGAFDCFEQMLGKGIHPDTVTLSCVLNACCHRYLVHEGETFFLEMSTKFGINPTIQHHLCLVTLLGHAGLLDKAVAAIQNMPTSYQPVVCCTLLGACHKWGVVDIGKWAFDYAIQLDEFDAAPYVYMANLYTDAGMQEDAKVVQSMRLRDSYRKNRQCRDETMDLQSKFFACANTVNAQ